MGTNAQTPLEHPLTWGFLATILLALAGFIGLLVGAWPLLWLPVLTPVFAFVFLKFSLKSYKGFWRFLAGYALGLVVAETAGIAILALVI